MYKARARLLFSLSIFLIGTSVSLHAATGFLSGAVRSSDGKAMEGVIVSARAQDQTYTTSVYTDKRGTYAFPALDSGQYKVWAQAVGFDAGKVTLAVVEGKKAHQDFKMEALKEFSFQMSPDELLSNMPERDMKDTRAKTIIANNCAVCHQTIYPLQNRFDKAGWTTMINYMSKIGGFGAEGEGDRIVYPFFQAYKDELVTYLTYARGPQTSTADYKAYPRASGDATKAIITEFDIPPADRPDQVIAHNGTDWSEGSPSAWDARAPHDAVLDKTGNVWFSDQPTESRTIGKLDPKTGTVYSYKLPGKFGTSVGTHGIIVDKENSVWFTNGEERDLTKFDPKTETFQRYPLNNSVQAAGGTLDLDSKGNIWALSRDGAVKLDPKNGQYTEYKGLTKGGGPYGLTVDANDNVWWSQIGKDVVGSVNSQTSEVKEISFPSLTDGITDNDREIAKKYNAGANSAPPQNVGPRRMGADKTGAAVWVCEYFTDKLAKIDPETNKVVAEYPVPHRYARPYSASVDKDHNVWIAMYNADRVAKFNPTTKKFTEYPLPSRGAGTRFVYIDNTTDTPTIWLPYYQNNKIARIQFKN